MSLRFPAERIFIRCPNWIGDMVAATGVLRGVRKNYPEAHISLVLQPYVRPVVEHAPWFDEIVEFDRSRGVMRETMRVARVLRQDERYDLGLLLTHSFQSAFMAWSSGARRRVGHAREGRSWLLTDAVPWPRKGGNAHLVAKVKLYGDLLAHLGCEGCDVHRPEVFTSDQDEAACEMLLAEHGREADRPLLGIVPGAAFGASKLWAPSNFAAVADTLSKTRGMQAAILAGPGEDAIGREIVRHMKTQGISFLEGEVSFGVLKAIVRRCALVICNDTGPRHVAIAYNVPTVVLMGPTDPAVTESDYPHTIILQQHVPCAPCYLRVCPTDHRCMELITPDMVVGAVDELLRAHGKRPEAEG